MFIIYKDKYSPAKSSSEANSSVVFILFRPHKCPDPKPRITTANNFVIRCARRAIGYRSKSMDRKFIHSRFCPVQTIRLPTDDGFFTCARFMVSFINRFDLMSVVLKSFAVKKHLSQNWKFEYHYYLKQCFVTYMII